MGRAEGITTVDIVLRIEEKEESARHITAIDCFEIRGERRAKANTTEEMILRIEKATDITE